MPNKVNKGFEFIKLLTNCSGRVKIRGPVLAQVVEDWTVVFEGVGSSPYKFQILLHSFFL